jgi:diacylglycerol O-acyltransferase / wax synthase
VRSIRDHLSALDLAFLLIEKPAVHMHVGGISIFDPVTRPGGTLSFGEFRRHLESRLCRMPRLRQRLQAGGWWVDDREFDLDRHLFNEALPRPGGQEELEGLVGRLLSEQLDRRHPLWETYFVEGLAGGRVAVVTKSHHAMGDGLAGLHNAEELFDSSPRPFRPGPVRPWRPEAGPSGSRRLLKRLLGLPIALPDLGRAASMMAMAAAGLAGFVAKGMKAPSSPLNGPLSQERAFASWRIPLEEAKAVHHGLGVSFNDMLLATTAGGLSRYLRGRGILPPRRVRALIPVSTSSGLDHAAGNQVSAFLLDLDLGRLPGADSAQLVRARTHTALARNEVAALRVAEELGALVPAPLQAAGLNAAMANRLFNLVVSNVRGVEHPLYLLGARHVVSYPLMPLAEGCGLSIAAMTAGGVMGVGITCDPNLVPHPERLAAGMSEAFEELARSPKASTSCPGEAAGKRRSRSGRKAMPRRLHRR